MNDLLVADSFLVDAGHVRGLDLHRSRFCGSCARHDVGASAFFDVAVAGLPRSGRWFPRFELVAGRELRLSLRPAPKASGAVRVQPYLGPDPRRAPRTKGPDLRVLGSMRDEARHSTGADEIVLTDQTGAVLEAAHASLLWWEGGTLCLPPQQLPLLPSVTVALLRQLAREQGVEVVERRRTPAQLDGREAWLVNALHGIRPVVDWLAPAPTACPPPRSAPTAGRPPPSAPAAGHSARSAPAAGHSARSAPAAGRPARAARWQDMLVSLATPLSS